MISFAAWFKLGEYSLAPCKQSNSSENAIDAKTNNEVEVLHVFDGDTFSVRIDGKIEMVRVIGIDAPETGEKYTKQECYALESKKRAIEILDGNKVYLEMDPTQQDRDKYDRMLRYVFVDDGTFFNEVMIEEGFAKEYTYQDVIYQHRERLVDAEQKAKENNQGLWKHCN